MTRTPGLLLRWLAAAALAIAGTAFAGEAVSFELSDDGARVVRLAESVYVIEHDDAIDEWPHGNTGVIVGRTGVFVIDSCYLPSRARADIELNQHYWKALSWKALSTAPDSARRAALATLESEPGDDAGIIERRRNELRELEALEIEDRGPANSPNDATVWLPNERILFAGDILVYSPLPYVAASWPVHWARVLRDIEAMPAAAIVPGHGPVMKDHGYTRAVRALMDATLARVEALVREGRTLAQVQDELNLDDVRGLVPEWRGPGVSAEDWDYTRRTLAERAFMGLRGQGAH